MPIREGVRRLWGHFKSNSSEHFDRAELAAAVSKRTDEGDNDSHKAISSPYAPSKIKLVRTIGTGSYGRVFYANVLNSANVLTDEAVAVKRLTKYSLIRQKQVTHIRQEKEILQQLNHPFIVNLLNSFHDECYLYLVMEFVPGGEFFTYLRHVKRLSPDSARFYAACVTAVFEYMHSLDILFRDLKPENLLIDLEGYLKLTDFGFAKHVTERTYTLCGTPEYVAPEVLLNKGHGKSVDWWTLGILIYEMISGYTPYADDDVMQIYQRILAGKILFPKGFDKDAKSLVKHLLQHDLSRRYGTLKAGADDIKTHRYMAPINFDVLLAKELPPPHIPTITNSADNFSIYQESSEKPLPVAPADDPFVDW